MSWIGRGLLLEVKVPHRRISGLIRQGLGLARLGLGHLNATSNRVYNVNQRGMADVVDNDYWRQKWKSNDLFWHEPDVHPKLVASLNKLVNERKPEDLTIFLPLCGKSLDLAFLHGQGFGLVTGSELWEKACEHVFEEAHLQYEREDVDAVRGLRAFVVSGAEKQTIQWMCVK
jgi:hypothetical protein